MTLPLRFLDRLNKYHQAVIRHKLFKKEFIAFYEMSAIDPRFTLQWMHCRPYMNDRNKKLAFDRHYFYHPAWAARVLAETKPSKHVDISSIIQFAGHISAFLPTEYYEFQDLDINLSGLNVGKADLCHLQFESSSVQSISCMHAIEHIGLGRYGDSLDPEGDLRAAAELERVVAQKGQLLLAVPISDHPRVEFNAHRIYSYDMLLAMFPNMKLVEFALIPDKAEHGGLIRHAKKDLLHGQQYACGCFHFIKKRKSVIGSANFFV